MLYTAFATDRLLRSVKNRFGPSNEIGVFEMVAGGLEDVADPSMLFLSTKHVDDTGDEVRQKYCTPKRALVGVS